MSKKRLGKISVHKEQLRHLTPATLATAVGGTQLPPSLYNCPTRDNAMTCFCPVLVTLACPEPSINTGGGSRAC